MKNNIVAVYRQEKPSYSYNKVKEGIESLFYFLGLDRKNYGKPDWNPLGELIHPGNHIVLKPNFLAESHKKKKMNGSK